MDIDLVTLHAIERDKEILVDYLVEVLKDALLSVYQKADSPLRGVKVGIDCKTGRVAALAPRLSNGDNVVGFYGGTPVDSRRVVVVTAR